MIVRRFASLLVASGSLATGAVRATDTIVPDMEYRGYLQSSAAHDTLDSDSILNPDNRLQLPSWRSLVTADVNLSVARGGVRAVAEVYADADLEQGDSDVDLYQGYASWSSSDLRYFLRAGRAVLGWGAGQIWNPVRGITNEGRKDLIFPDQAVPGIDLLEARAFLAGGTITLLALVPEQSAGEWGYALRYASNVGQVDYALSVYSDLHGRQRAGGELSLPMGPVTLVGEAVLTDSSDRTRGERSNTGASQHTGSAMSYVLGANVVLPRDFVLIAEYYHDGSGLDSAETRRFLAALPAQAHRYSVFGNGHDNLYLGLTRPLTWRDSSMTVGTFANIESRSGLLQARFETQLTDSARLLLSYIEYWEYGGRDVGFFDRSIEARVRFSF